MPKYHQADGTSSIKNPPLMVSREETTNINKGGSVFGRSGDDLLSRALRRALSKKRRYSGVFCLQALWNILASEESVSA